MGVQEHIDAAFNRIDEFCVSSSLAYDFNVCALTHTLQGLLAYRFPLYWIVIIAYQGYDYWLTNDKILLNLLEYVYGWAIAAVIVFIVSYVKSSAKSSKQRTA